MNPRIALDIIAPPAASATGIYEVTVSHAAEIERAAIGPSLAAVMQGAPLSEHLPACATLIWLLSHTPAEIRDAAAVRDAEIAALPDTLTPTAFRSLLVECLHALARAHAPAPDGDDSEKPDKAGAKKKPSNAKPPERTASDGSRRSPQRATRRTGTGKRSGNGVQIPR